MVADKVEIITKSYQEGTEPARWICTGSTEFEITEAQKDSRGTDIILHVNEDSQEFLEPYRLRSILEKYGKFLPIPVFFDGNEETEDKDGNKSKKGPEQINETKPLWTKPTSELKDEDYLAFYKELYPFGPDPLFWIHLNVDYPFNLTGILYFPKLQNDFELHKNKIQLYSRQVFITDEVKDIVPEFLQLLHGVIDSPDIPLNVSRSFLQADGNVKKINSHITKKVADKLQELYKNDRSAYENKWDDIGLFVKYGMMTDDKFYDRVKGVALVKNLEGKFFTLEEYAEHVKGNQTDKNEQQVWLYTTDASKQHTFTEAAKRKGYDVILFDSPIDNHFIGTLEQKLEKTSLKRVDADTADKLIEKDEALESVLSKDEEEKVKTLFEGAINDKSRTVTVAAQSPDEMPVTLTMPEFMRRMKDMQGMQGMMMGTMPDMYTVTVNANHPLTGRILKAEGEEQQQKLAKQAYDLALLGQGLLQGQSLTDFIHRSADMLGVE
jgi:molecular chaperone HtpG